MRADCVWIGGLTFVDVSTDDDESATHRYRFGRVKAEKCYSLERDIKRLGDTSYAELCCSPDLRMIGVCGLDGDHIGSDVSFVSFIERYENVWGEPMQSAKRREIEVGPMHVLWRDNEGSKSFHIQQLGNSNIIDFKWRVINYEGQNAHHLERGLLPSPNNPLSEGMHGSKFADEDIPLSSSRRRFGRSRQPNVLVTIDVNLGIVIYRETDPWEPCTFVALSTLSCETIRSHLNEELNLNYLKLDLLNSFEWIHYRVLSTRAHWSWESPECTYMSEKPFRADRIVRITGNMMKQKASESGSVKESNVAVLNDGREIRTVGYFPESSLVLDGPSLIVSANANDPGSRPLPPFVLTEVKEPENSRTRKQKLSDNFIAESNKWEFVPCESFDGDRLSFLGENQTEEGGQHNECDNIITLMDVLKCFPLQIGWSSSGHNIQEYGMLLNQTGKLPSGKDCTDFCVFNFLVELVDESGTASKRSIDTIWKIDDVARIPCRAPSIRLWGYNWNSWFLSRPESVQSRCSMVTEEPSMNDDLLPLAGLKNCFFSHFVCCQSTPVSYHISI